MTEYSQLKEAKILLMSPLMNYEDRWGQYSKGAGDTFPQGIGSIAGYIEKMGISADVLEPDIEKMDQSSFLSFIKEKKYNIIGISAFTPNIQLAYDTAKIIKSRNPNTLIVFGGSHPTIFPERTLEECEFVDFVITNEGEKPFLFLINSLLNDLNFKKVPNLYYRENSNISRSDVVSEWLDLDELDIFPYHKFNLSKYIPAPSLRKVLPTFNYMAQRGCPYLCSFCDTRTHGKKVRYRSIPKVIEDLKYLKSKFGIKGLVFEGSNFTLSTKWVRELCENMINEKLKLSWYCMGRVDLDNDLIPLMKKSGLWCMSFGIESANNLTLERMKKNINTEKVKETISILKKEKIRSVGSFILGYPGETEDDVLNTIDYACNLNIDVAVFFIPVPFPGTKLYQDALNDGGLKKDIKWADYSAWLDHNNPIYINPLIGNRQIDLYNFAFKKFYTRPSYMLQQIRNIKSMDDVNRLFQGFKSVKGLILNYFKKRKR